MVDELTPSPGTLGCCGLAGDGLKEVRSVIDMYDYTCGGITPRSPCIDSSQSRLSTNQNVSVNEGTLCSVCILRHPDSNHTVEFLLVVTLP